MTTTKPKEVPSLEAFYGDAETFLGQPSKRQSPTDTDFSELRSILNGQVTSQSYTKLIETLLPLEFDEIIASYVLGRLQHWPNKLSRYASLRSLARFFRQEEQKQDELILRCSNALNLKKGPLNELVCLWQAFSHDQVQFLASIIKRFEFKALYLENLMLDDKKFEALLPFLGQVEELHLEGNVFSSVTVEGLQSQATELKIINVSFNQYLDQPPRFGEGTQVIDAGNHYSNAVFLQPGGSIVLANNFDQADYQITSAPRQGASSLLNHLLEQEGWSLIGQEEEE